MIVVTYLLRQSITLYKNLGGLEPLSPIASAATDFERGQAQSVHDVMDSVWCGARCTGGNDTRRC